MFDLVQFFLVWQARKKQSRRKEDFQRHLSNNFHIWYQTKVLKVDWMLVLKNKLKAMKLNEMIKRV